MSILVQQVMDKLNREIVDVKGRAEDVMKQAVKDALISFCSQSEDFGTAIIENDKTFVDCMKEVAKDFKDGISDYEAYRRAVKFYFPTAEIEFQMKIRTSPRANILSFNLLDLMGGGNE